MGLKIDFVRTLALLWGPAAAPGRSGLTGERIVEAAVAIADAHGYAAVSMREVASRLRVGTMSLYTHVPGKGELTELMVDRIYGELYDDVDAVTRATSGWREALTFIAERNWELFQRHPWIHDAPHARPVIGPNLTLKYEAELRPLDGIGLSDVEMDSVLTLVLTHVGGTARIQAGLAQERRETGMTDEEWWTTIGPHFERVIEGGRFPVASRVGEASSVAYEGVFSGGHAFRFGLERILDGVGVIVDGRRMEGT